MPYCEPNGKYKFKIAFNAALTHKDRKRFTIAEEMTHMILGHYECKMYNVFNADIWSEKLYASHEKEARIGVGILLCPPPMFYRTPAFFNVGCIRTYCAISEPSAITRYDILRKYRYEIERHPLYSVLSDLYEDYINSIPSPKCGTVPIIRSEGVCCSCAATKFSSEILMCATSNGLH